MKTIIRVFFQCITWADGSCYAYTSNKSYKCRLDVGNGVESTFRVSFKRASDIGSKKTAKDFATMWLSDSDGNALPKEEALVYRDVYGASAYLCINEDDSVQLVSEDDYQQLSSDEQSLLSTTLPASV